MNAPTLILMDVDQHAGLPFPRSLARRRDGRVGEETGALSHQRAQALLARDRGRTRSARPRDESRPSLRRNGGRPNHP